MDLSTGIFWRLLGFGGFDGGFFLLQLFIKLSGVPVLIGFGQNCLEMDGRQPGQTQDIQNLVQQGGGHAAEDAFFLAQAVGPVRLLLLL